MRNQFTFYKSFDDVIQELTDEQIATYMRTMLDVQFLRVKIEDVKFNDPILNIVWKSQKHSIETSINGYLDSQKGKNIKNPYLGIYGENDNNKNTPQGGNNTPSEGVAQQDKVQEQVKGKVKEEEKEEEPNPPFKNMKIKPNESIKFYKENISSKQEDIQEQSSFNELVLKAEDSELIKIGLLNYAYFLKNSNKSPEKLFFFIRNKIYLDYQEAKTANGIPKELIGKQFRDESGEEYEFKEDGVYRLADQTLFTGPNTIKDKLNFYRANSLNFDGVKAKYNFGGVQNG